MSPFLVKLPPSVPQWTTVGSLTARCGFCRTVIVFQYSALFTGNIEPPRNFKKYKTRFVPPPTPEDSPSQSNVRLQVMWNRMLPNKPRPYLWKLSYKLNNPHYEHVQDEILMRKNFARRRHLPRVTTHIVQWNELAYGTLERNSNVPRG